VPETLSELGPRAPGTARHWTTALNYSTVWGCLRECVTWGSTVGTGLLCSNYCWSVLRVVAVETLCKLECIYSFPFKQYGIIIV